LIQVSTISRTPGGAARTFARSARCTGNLLRSLEGPSRVIATHLRNLRERGLIGFRGRGVAIRDHAGFEEVAEFDPGYLYLEPEAR